MSIRILQYIQYTISSVQCITANWKLQYSIEYTILCAINSFTVTLRNVYDAYNNLNNIMDSR